MGLSIRVNGGECEVGEGATLADLVRQLDLRPELVAIERNGALVRRAQHAVTALERGDEIEIVTLVGGG